MTDDMLQKLLALHHKLRDKHEVIRANHVAHVLARSAKVSEEYGELMDEVLSHLSLQRRDKLNAYKRDNLAKEYADTVLALYLLGLSLDLNIDQVVSNRLDEKYQEYVK